MEPVERSAPPGPEPSPGAVWIDRQDEAQSVLDFVLSARSPLVLLFGKNGIGKTSLILHWVIPSALERRQEAFYGECSEALPERVSGRSGDLDLWTAVARPGLIFLDSFERVLDLPEDRRNEILAGLCARVGSPEHAAVLVLVLDETRLGRAFALRSYLPEVAHAACEIKGVPTVDGAAALQSVAQRQGLDCEPAVLDALAADAEALDRGEGVSPDLLRIVGDQLQRLRRASQQPLDLPEYRAMGGLENLLRGFLDRRLEEVAEGGISREVSLAILEEVAAARRAGREPELAGLAERLEVTDPELQRALTGLQGAGGLLRERKSGGVEVVPGVVAVVDREAARRRLDTRESQWILREGAKAWAQVGTLPARETFARIEGQRRRLEVTDDEAALALQCALRYQGEEDLGSARYWLRRIRSEEARVEPLLLALFDPLPAVRAKAATLLAGSHQPEVREQLHLLALKDEESRVRTAAANSLREMKTQALRELLVQEVIDERSPYRERAVDALRIFPEERTIAVLRKLVEDGASPPPLRGRAIEVLSVMQVSAATEALVEIALHDEDPEDRHAAAVGLGSRQDESLVRDSLERLRAARPSAGETHGLAWFRSYLPSVGWAALAVLVALANVFIHGLALLVLRRYWLGALVLAVEGVAWWLMTRDEGCSLILFWLLLYLVSFNAGQLLPAGLLLRQRKAGRLEMGTFRSALAATTTLSAVAWVHGVAHALIGRWRRATALFLCEIVGIALWFTAWNKDSSPIWKLYFWIGLALFFGSFFYDVVPVLREVLGSELTERRWATYRELLRGRIAPALILERLGSADREDASWARSLLRRCGAEVEPDLLLEHLQDEGPARRFVVRHLARNKREELIQRLCGLWSNADETLRHTLLAILVRRPTEASVAALRQLSPLSFGQRLRAALSPWQFRLRVWPKSVVAAALLVLPLIAWAAYLGLDIYRPLLHDVERTGANPDDRIAAAEYLAKVYPDKAFEPLARVFRDTQNEGVQAPRGIAHSLGLIANNVTTNPEVRQKAFAELVAGLTRWSDPEIRETIVAELDNEHLEPARQALQAAVEQKPDGASILLLGRIYLRQGRPVDAEKELLRLRERHQDLGFALMSFYHEDLSQTDPEAFEKAYREARRIADADSSPGSQANLAEAQLTSGRFPEAAQTAQEILSRSPDPTTELNLQFIRLAALVLAGQRSEAEKPLGALQASYSALPPNFRNDWTYGGTLRFLRKSALPPELREQLVSLCELIQTRHPDTYAQQVFAATRAALRAP